MSARTHFYSALLALALAAPVTKAGADERIDAIGAFMAQTGMTFGQAVTATLIMERLAPDAMATAVFLRDNGTPLHDALVAVYLTELLPNKRHEDLPVELHAGRDPGELLQTLVLLEYLRRHP